MSTSQSIEATRFQISQLQNPDQSHSPLLAYDWIKVLQVLGIPAADILVFISEPNPDIEPEVMEPLNEELTVIDEDVADEALAQPGAIWYQPAQKEKNGGKKKKVKVNFCAWDNPVSARAATALPKHQEAIQFIVKHNMYKKYSTQWLRVTDEGAKEL